MLVPEFFVVIVYHKIPPVGESFPVIFLRQPVRAGAQLRQHQLSRLGGVVHIVAVIIQLLNDVPVKQQSVERYVLIGQQRFAGQLQRGEYRVRFPMRSILSQ